jgi:hypothetical protein
LKITTARRRLATHMLLAAAATIVVLESVVTIAWSSSAPGWSHWLCSPTVLRSAVHTVGGSGFGATLLTALKVHWPHFLPILVGLATLVYLWRANARYGSTGSRSPGTQRPKEVPQRAKRALARDPTHP